MYRRIFFRADGNESIGLGHIYRCCAVAQILNADQECYLVVKSINEVLKNQISKYFRCIFEIEKENLKEKDWWQKLTGKEIVILDGYHFDSLYQLELKKFCLRLVCIDDIHSCHFYADVVINHAGGVLPSTYDKEPYTKLFLGPSYAIVRSGFWRKPLTPNRLDNHAFVCLGGADPKNDLAGILQGAFRKEPALFYHVVTGSAYKFEAELKATIALHSKVNHYKNLDETAMKELMQKCCVAIVSPSTVSYEYLSIGGEAYLHTIADNQIDIYNYFIKDNIAFPFHRFRVGHREEVRNALQKQNQVFDGESHLRIKEAILDG
jgi:UDP-2,4-diacetamido-2,4,6-trideoxy-beta-L-altropyranose hydrolase